MYVTVVQYIPLLQDGDVENDLLASFIAPLDTMSLENIGMVRLREVQVVKPL